jgi:hypothetical protein
MTEHMIPEKFRFSCSLSPFGYHILKGDIYVWKLIKRGRVMIMIGLGYQDSETCLNYFEISYYDMSTMKAGVLGAQAYPCVLYVNRIG